MRVYREQGLENLSIMTALKSASPDMTAVFHAWLMVDLSGFATGVENMGGALQNLMEGGA